MSRNVYYAAMSADGFIADSDGGVGWLDPFDAKELGAESFFAGVGAVVLGRATYELALSFGPWPYEDRPGLVISSRDLQGLPPNVRRIPVEALAESVRDLRSKIQGDVWIVGGGRTARACLDAGLLGELELYVVPRMLGAGLPLFGDGPRLTDLELIDTKAFGSGVVRMRWRVRA
jgi:dihydrofolate reductase